MNCFLPYFFSMIKIITSMQVISNIDKFSCYNQLIDELQEVIKEIEYDLIYIIENKPKSIYLYHTNKDVLNMLNCIEISQYTDDIRIIKLYYRFKEVSNELNNELILYHNEIENVKKC